MEWITPTWLLPHQPGAARRIAASLEAFRGALLADEVGLGKTYVALAVASRYRKRAAVVPPVLVPQWRAAAERMGIELEIVADSVLSQGHAPPRADLLIVDEAHRFRNPDTRRHQALARRSRPGHLLLVTATPVVNRARDLGALLSLFLPDNGLALFGIDSINAACTARDHVRIARAASVLTVARSADGIDSVDLPKVLGGGVERCPPVDNAALTPILDLVAGLRFPAMGNPASADLLRLHLRYRLASSSAAFMETVRRHLAYLDRAERAAVRGEALPRGEARRLFGPDEEAQLDLGLLDATGPAIDAAAIPPERDRLLLLLEILRRESADDPKGHRLAEILATRSGHRTLVFVSSLATARFVVRLIGWKEVALVAGEGAWIASGRVPREEALGAFAPGERPRDQRSLRISTLIATDLASEGLDLQAADGVIHYDLPWTPLRLEQRLGRIARIGSPHSAVGVWWFAPPPLLDVHLGLERRLADKARTQIELAMPSTSRMGRPRVLNQLVSWRERFSVARGPAPSSPCYAVVDGPPCALFALTWILGTRSVPEVVVISGGRVLEREPDRSELIEQLGGGSPAPGDLVSEELEALSQVVRERLLRPHRATSDYLYRLAEGVAIGAQAFRDGAMLAALDRVVDRIGRGVTAGGRYRLWRALQPPARRVELERWLRAFPPLVDGSVSVRLDAAIFGRCSR